MPTTSGTLEYAKTAVDDATQLAGVDVTAMEDGSLAFLRGSGQYYHLVKSSSATPDGINTIATKSGVGRWLLGPGGIGGTYEFVFRPSEPAPSGNVFASWSALVTAARLQRGEKIVYFDNSLAPTTIPAGAWDFLSPTEFCGDPSLSGTATLVTIADGATLANVFIFRDVQVICQSTTFVVDAPDRDVRYQLFGTATLKQTGAGGCLFRESHARTWEIDLFEESSILANAGAVVVRSTIAGAVLFAITFDSSLIQASTFAGVAGTIGFISVTSASASGAFTQAGMPGGNFGTQIFGAVSSQVTYTPAVLANWNNVAPLLVSTALDRIAAKITPIP